MAVAEGGVSSARQALELVSRDPVGAEGAARRALVAAGRAGDRGEEALARRVLGVVARDGQRFSEARDHFLAGIAAAEDGGLAEVAALCRLSLAGTLSLVGDVDGALAAVDSAAAALSGVDQARARFQRGGVLQAAGDHDGALAAYAAVEPQLRELDDTVALAQLRNNCGVIRLVAGDLVGAVLDFEVAERLYRETGMRKMRADACTHLALVAARRGDALTALRWYDEVDAELRELGVTDPVALKDRVEVLLAAGLTNEAAVTAERAVELLAPGGDSTYLAEAILARATAERAAGRSAASAELERQAVAVLGRLGLRTRGGGGDAPEPPAGLRVPAPPTHRPRRPLNEALRAVREARGVTQTDLAAALGIDQAVCSRWETNPAWAPRIDDIVAIDDALAQPRGTLLRTAGYLDDITTTEQAVLADPNLGPDGRDAILLLVRYYHQRPTPPPRRGRKPKDRR